MLTLGIPPGEGLFQMQCWPSKSGPLSASLNLRSPSSLDDNAPILSNRTSSPTQHELAFDLNTIY